LFLKSQHKTQIDFFQGQADEIIAKLNEVKVKQDAFKQKIVAAEASKKYAHLLEYQVRITTTF